MCKQAFIYSVFFLFSAPLWPQNADSAAIDALWLRAHRIHIDSAETAQKLCFDIINQSEKAHYLKGQGDAYITLAILHRNNGDYSKSYHFLSKSLGIRRLLGDSNRVAAVFINRGINFMEECKYDSAIAVVTYAINIVESLPEPEYDVLGSEYMLLSNILDEYLELEDALDYARKSLKAYQKTKQAELIGKASYALANRFNSLGKSDSALIYYDQAYSNFQASSQNLDYLSEIMINKGIVYLKMGEISSSGIYFDKAETLLKRLGEKADWFHFYLNKGAWYVAKNDWEKGLDLLKKVLPNDASELTFLDQLYLFENLSNGYAHLLQYDSAYYYQNAAYAVRDSLYNENKRKEFVRFQTERYKKETAQQALATQKQASRARIYLLSTGLLVLLTLLIIYAYFQRKRAFKLIQSQQEKLHQQEVDDLIQNSELRYLNAGLEGRELEKEQIARELHDHLGSTIVTLSWQYDAILDNTARNSKNYQSLLGLNVSLKQLYQDIRQIAHQLGSGVLERAGLVPVLNELCQSIESGNKIEVSFAHFGMDNRLGFTHEVNILRIIQELVSNVLKYAKATQLMIQINHIEGVVNIMVEDNGIGFDQKKAFLRSGVGLQNIEARLRSINGTIQFENRPLGGTTVIINIPVPKPSTL